MTVDGKKNNWSGFAWGTNAEELGLERIADDELAELARQWRLEALRGRRDARGKAHSYESELRRRHGRAAELVEAGLLDTRPLAARTEAPPWWRRLWTRTDT